MRETSERALILLLTPQAPKQGVAGSSPAGIANRYNELSAIRLVTEFNREVLGPEITNLMDAIWNYQPSTYPEELLRAAGAMLTAAPGLVALDAGEDVRQEVSKIIGGPISGESMGDIAHAIRRWAATLTEDGKRIH